MSTVTLYHGTTADAAAEIEQSGLLVAGSYFGGIHGVSLTPRLDVAEQFGPVVISVTVDRSNLIVDPESFDNSDVDTALAAGASVYHVGDLRI